LTKRTKSSAKTTKKPASKASPNRQAALSLSDLRAAVSGQVIGPDDPGYDQARTVFIGGVDRRPAVIIRAADAADVARVIALARETGLPLAVRSGGHSGAAYSVVDDGIVLDLSDMRALDIDVAGRTAWAEAGLTAAEYTSAAAAHGLATGFGDTGSVGLGGLILGGGVGYLVRKYGLTIDDLLAADIVTADGQRLRVDAQTHPDLFWAIRGGGGNFGVATRFQLRLHPVDQVLGGLLVLPATADAIQGFMAAAEAAPDELSTIANIMPAPPMPFLAAEHHGKLVILAMLVYAGEVEAGQRAVAPFRALAAPLADLVHPMPYPEIYPPEDSNYHPMGVTRTLFMDVVDLATAQAIVDHLQASTAMMAVTQLRALGGAMARVPADATAFAHRGRRIMVNVAALYQQPEELPTHTAWANELAAVLTQGEPNAYVNFLADEGAARVRQAYPGPTWDRLAAIKQRYDPANLFRLNQNIPPAVDGSAKSKL
jgi:FAD/FMN-containing dehydrogenase